MVTMKKSFCAFLCILILLGSVAVVSFAESTPDPTHQSGCDCSVCVSNRDNSDLSYVEPTADTTVEKKGPIEDIISKIAGDELVDVGKNHDVNKFMALGKKITAQIRDFFAKLAERAAALSDRLRHWFKIR